MRFSFAGILAVAATGLAVLSSAAQTATSTAPVQQPAVQANPQKQPSGQVIFSRSTGESGQTITQAGPAAPQPAIKMAAEPSAGDAEREAVTFTSLDLDMLLAAEGRLRGGHNLFLLGY